MTPIFKQIEMLNAYIDESGGLDTHKPDKSGSKRFFSLVMVITEDRHNVAGTIADLVEDYPNMDEIKHSAKTETFSRRFADNMRPLLEDDVLKVLGTVVDTQGMPRRHNLEENFERKMYERLCKYMAPDVDKIDYTGGLKIHIDGCWPSEKQKIFSNKVEDAMEDYFETISPVKTEHVDSRKEKNVQCADMFAGYIREDAGEKGKDQYYLNKLEKFTSTHNIDPNWHTFTREQ